MVFEAAAYLIHRLAWGLFDLQYFDDLGFQIGLGEIEESASMGCAAVRQY